MSSSRFSSTRTMFVAASCLNLTHPEFAECRNDRFVFGRGVDPASAAHSQSVDLRRNEYHLSVRLKRGWRTNKNNDLQRTRSCAVRDDNCPDGVISTFRDNHLRPACPEAFAPLPLSSTLPPLRGPISELMPGAAAEMRHNRSWSTDFGTRESISPKSFLRRLHEPAQGAVLPWEF